MFSRQIVVLYSFRFYHKKVERVFHRSDVSHAKTRPAAEIDAPLGKHISVLKPELTHISVTRVQSSWCEEETTSLFYQVSD